MVAVIRRDERVLVIRRGPQATSTGFWSPVSGRIEPGERQDEAVVREVREEVGLDVSAVEKVWECTTDDGRFLLHWWTVEEAGAAAGPLKLAPGEASDARWVDPEEFLGLEPTFEGDREFFVRVLPKLDPDAHS